jgi:RimJ/RimL family protein N-acetyltransferase
MRRMSLGGGDAVDLPTGQVPFRDSAPTLDTDRLILRPLSREDSAQLVAIYNEKEVLAGLHRSAVTVEEVRSWTTLLAQAARGGRRYGVAVIHRESGELAGFAELERSTWMDDWAEITIVLGAAHRGQGYATEGGQALIEWAFWELQLGRVTALVLPANDASLKLVQSLKMAKLGERDVESRSGAELVRCIEFQLDREAWLDGLRLGCGRNHDDHAPAADPVTAEPEA